MIFVKPMKRSLPFYWHQTHLKSAKFFLFQKNVNMWSQSWQTNILFIIYFPCCFVLLHKRHFIKKDSIYLFTLLFTFSRSLLRTTSSCSLRQFLEHMFTSINISCGTLTMSAKNWNGLGNIRLGLWIIAQGRAFENKAFKLRFHTFTFNLVWFASFGPCRAWLEIEPGVLRALGLCIAA